MLITVVGSAEAFAMPWLSRFWIVRKKMPIIRDVRERVLTKRHELQPQASGNKVVGISLVILSIAISAPPPLPW
jgi:hypothetical protein